MPLTPFGVPMTNDEIKAQERTIIENRRKVQERIIAESKEREEALAAKQKAEHEAMLAHQKSKDAARADVEVKLKAVNAAHHAEANKDPAEPPPHPKDDA